MTRNEQVQKLRWLASCVTPKVCCEQLYLQNLSLLRSFFEPEELQGLRSREVSQLLRLKAEQLVSESASQKRAFFRRWCWASLPLLWLVLHLTLRETILSRTVDLFKGLNLSLPVPTRLFVSLPWQWLILAAILLAISPKPAEQRLERKLRATWEMLLASVTQKSRDPWSFRAEEEALEWLFYCEDDPVRRQKALRAWKNCLEWDLQWKHWSRRQNLKFAASGVVALLALYVPLAVMLPFTQILG